jgi:hypothetical protein
MYVWVKAEGGPDDNPLNILTRDHKVIHFGSPAKAAIATIANLRRDKSNSNGYATILGSATKGDKAQLMAIAASKWEETHYGGGTKLKAAYEANFPDPPGSGFWDWVGQDVLHPVQGLQDAASFYQNALGGLLNGNTWIRALMVIMGSIALLGAMFLFTKELGNRA